MLDKGNGLHLEQTAHIDLPWSINKAWLWYFYFDPVFDTSKYGYLKLEHCLTLQVVLLDDLLYFVTEPVLCVPNVLLFNDVEVLGADLLHTRNSLANNFQACMIVNAEILGFFILIFQSEVAHPFFIVANYFFPLECI